MLAFFAVGSLLVQTYAITVPSSRYLAIAAMLTTEIPSAVVSRCRWASRTRGVLDRHDRSTCGVVLGATRRCTSMTAVIHERRASGSGFVMVAAGQATRKVRRPRGGRGDAGHHSAGGDWCGADSGQRPDTPARGPWPAVRPSTLGCSSDPQLLAIAAARQDSRFDPIAQTPQAKWFSDWSTSATVRRDIGDYLASAAAANAVPTIVLYRIPQLDCGGGERVSGCTGCAR